MIAIYRSEQLEVEYDKTHDDFYMTIYDSCGLESDYLNFSRDEMHKLVNVIKEKLDEKDKIRSIWF